MRTILLLFSLFSSSLCQGQSFDPVKARNEHSYLKFRDSILDNKDTQNAGAFSEFGPGVITRIAGSKKVMALTFDACGGSKGSGYDVELITFLKKERISATLFVAGSWISANRELFRKLCKEPLFEIENHGLTHRPCSIDGKGKYGINGTRNPSEAFDEIEVNARQIEFYAGRKPRFYRTATCFNDEGCTAIAAALGERIISYELLSGDAVAGSPAEMIKSNLVNRAKPGAIVIMHMNHPDWNGLEGLKEAYQVWKKAGYTFVKLEDQSLQ